MRVFLVPEDVVVVSPRFNRHYYGKQTGPEVPVDMLIVDSGGEMDMVSKALVEKKKKASAVTDTLDEVGDKSKDESLIADGKVRAYGEQDLLNWPAFPARLGRVSTRFIGAGMYKHEEEAPLAAQLSALKARFPQKHHFRIAAVAAFGTNLGDCLIGMTAMRIIVETIRQYLPSFVIDMLLCTAGNPGNVDIVGHEPWVGELHITGPSVSDFARYDAYFDFTGLIGLPRITEMPIVEWFLWWSGLNPSLVPADRKRNILNIAWPVWSQVSPLLKGIKGKRVLFNPTASVPLRSFPGDQAVAFVQKLLKQDQDLTIIIDKPLKLKHPRLVDLSNEIDSPQKFEALVAQVDGLITVDTFGIHVADAANVPTVGLFASIPPDAYPFYPLHHGILIPGGADLPAYRKFKVNDEKDWTEIKDVYDKAWAKLDAKDVLKGLNQMMEKQQLSASHKGLQFVHGPHQPLRFAVTPEGRKLPFEKEVALWDRAVVCQGNIARVILRPGVTTVVIAPGQSPFTLLLAEKLALGGVLHLFEPRPLRRTLIGMDLLDKASHVDIHWHDSLPSKAKEVIITGEDALCETNPLYWGSLKKKISLDTKAIDSLELQVLSAIFSFAPTPHLHVLESALDTLKRTKAAIICSPIYKEEEVRHIAAFLVPLGYQCWVEYIEQREDGPMMLVAISDHIKLQGHSMKRIVPG